MNQDRPEDLFDVFEPWTPRDPGDDAADTADTEASGRPPWEPPPPPPPPSSHAIGVSRPTPLSGVPSYTPEGAVEPGMVVLAASAPRKRRRRVGPRVPPPAVPTPRPDPVREPGRFLRVVGIPEVSRVLGRLEDDGHRGNIQDLLDLASPAMRLLLWPKPGLLSHGGERTLATLEFVGELDDSEPTVTTRYWFGSPGEGVTPLGQTPLDELSEQWILGQALDFVKVVLDRS